MLSKDQLHKVVDIASVSGAGMGVVAAIADEDIAYSQTVPDVVTRVPIFPGFTAWLTDGSRPTISLPRVDLIIDTHSLEIGAFCIAALTFVWLGSLAYRSFIRRRNRQNKSGE